MQPFVSSSNRLAIITLSLVFFMVGCSENTPSNDTPTDTTVDIPDGMTDGVTDGTNNETNNDTNSTVPDTTQPQLELVADKTFRISWEAREGAKTYRVFENPDGVAGFSPISESLDSSTLSFDHRVALFLRVNASYLVETCYATACVNSEATFLSGTLDDAVGYIKASNAEGGSLSPGQQESPAVIGGDKFGLSVSLSTDGNTMAVTAPGEDSAATGVNGNQSDNTDNDSGAVYVFVRDNQRWQQQAYLKASSTDERCCFSGSSVIAGTGLSLSGDGNTLAVGAYSNESDTATVSIFKRSNGEWQQQASLMAGYTIDEQGESILNDFGDSLSLTANGDLLVVGAPSELSMATGVNGNQNDSSGNRTGAAYVFARTDDSWTEQAYLKASNTSALAAFGDSVAISADGSTIVVGATGDSSVATGVMVRPTSEELTQDLSNDNAGAAYVFSRSGESWQQQAFIKASNSEGRDRFGENVTVSANGNTIAIAAAGKDNFAGAVYTFTRIGGDWMQQAYLKASNLGLASFAQFGSAVSISADGNSLAVGARGEAGFSNGINGDQNAVLPKPSFGQPNGAIYIGAAYVFTRNADDWQQVAYVKATNNTDDVENPGISFGESLSLSGDGQTLIVGASDEAGGVSGINSDRFDRSAPGAGAVFVY